MITFCTMVLLAIIAFMLDSKDRAIFFLWVFVIMILLGFKHSHNIAFR